MGNSEGIASQLAPHTSRRQSHRSMSKQMEEEIMKEYDKSHTGVLSRQEVKEMATKILGRYAPELGGLEFEEIDLIMMCGGDTVQPELRAEELPGALAIICRIKEENENLVRLFRKYDVDKSGDLPASQLKPLLQEVYDGIEPPEDDIAYILRQCEPRGAEDPIKQDQLKAALACWYCLADDSSMERQMADKEMAKRDSEKEERKKAAAAQKKKADEEKKPTQAEEPKREQKELVHGSSNRRLDEQLVEHMKHQLDEAHEAKRRAAEEAKADEEQRMRAEEEARRAAEEEQRRKAKEEQQRVAEAAHVEEQKRRTEEQAMPKSSQPAPGFFSSLLDTISCNPCVSGKKGEDVADAEAPATPACDDKPI